MASTFDIFARDPSIGRAEALRRAMIKALDQAPTTERTHPLFWAPFVVVGDGGPSRRPAKMGRIGCEVSGLPFGAHSRHLG